jgi:hypothetical protein
MIPDSLSLRDKITDNAGNQEADQGQISINLAIGILTFYGVVLLLVVANFLISLYYHPDVSALVRDIASSSLKSTDDFHPEPVERMQFIFSVFFSPVCIFFLFGLISRFRRSLSQKLHVTRAINVAGINVLIGYLFVIFQRKLEYINNDASFFFSNNILYNLNFFVCLFIYGIITFCFFAYLKRQDTYQRIVKFVTNEIIALTLLQTVFYNVFHLATEDYLRTMETNAVFYSLTQVMAGKTLLVNLTSQYGLYALFLYPFFKLGGVTVFSFGLVMGMLNAASFLFIYLGLKRIVKQDLLRLIVFLALVFWQYWQTRLPYDTNPRYYYQYWPIRTFFPSLLFYLISVFSTRDSEVQKRLVPIIAILSSIAVLWNLDTGLVVYCAAFAALVFPPLHYATVGERTRQFIKNAGWMLSSFVVVLVLFVLFTKMRSGAWPDFSGFFKFQKVFYVSGYFMLAMSAVHFWNAVILVYLAAGVFVVCRIGDRSVRDNPVLVFLFICGFGLFSYFQGRSYDTNLTVVMFPAIVLLGIFCDKLLSIVSPGRKYGTTLLILFLIPFIFLLDGAFSMVGAFPSMFRISFDNAFHRDEKAKKNLDRKIEFIRHNFRNGDTVLILANDYESYYYCIGNYYNPANLPSSTEYFFKSELYTVLDVIKSRRYPILYDVSQPPANADTILKALTASFNVSAELAGDNKLLILKPGQGSVANESHVGEIAYYDHLEHLNTNSLFSKLSLPDTFTMDMLISPLDTAKLWGQCWLFNNATLQTPFSGIKMEQRTSDLTAFTFAYGDGKHWCEGPVFKMSCRNVNYLVVHVQKNVISVSNNGVLFGSVNTGSTISNSAGQVNLDADFPGSIAKVRILDH